MSKKNRRKREKREKGRGKGEGTEKDNYPREHLTNERRKNYQR